MTWIIQEVPVCLVQALANCVSLQFCSSDVVYVGHACVVGHFLCSVCCVCIATVRENLYRVHACDLSHITLSPYTAVRRLSSLFSQNLSCAWVEFLSCCYFISSFFFHPRISQTVSSIIHITFLHTGATCFASVADLFLFFSDLVNWWKALVRLNPLNLPSFLLACGLQMLFCIMSSLLQLLIQPAMPKYLYNQKK